MVCVRDRNGALVVARHEAINFEIGSCLAMTKRECSARPQVCEERGNLWVTPKSFQALMFKNYKSFSIPNRSNVLINVVNVGLFLFKNSKSFWSLAISNKLL